MDGRRRPAPERRSTSSALETGAGDGAVGSGFMEVTFGGGGLAAGGGGGGSGARGFICFEAGFVAVNGIFIESGPQETTHASPGGTTSGLAGMVGSGDVFEGEVPATDAKNAKTQLEIQWRSAGTFSFTFHLSVITSR